MELPIDGIAETNASKLKLGLNWTLSKNILDYLEDQIKPMKI